MLFGLDLDQDDAVRRWLANAKDDLRRDFHIDDFPYGYFWAQLRKEPSAEGLHNAPFIGTVKKATTANMESLVIGLDLSHVVCLTEPRIVDALFDNCGALLIQAQNPDSPQCHRLRSRAVPFAMLDGNRMAALSDGEHVVVTPSDVKVVRNA